MKSKDNFSHSFRRTANMVKQGKSSEILPWPLQPDWTLDVSWLQTRSTFTFPIIWPGLKLICSRFTILNCETIFSFPPLFFNRWIAAKKWGKNTHHLGLCRRHQLQAMSVHFLWPQTFSLCFQSCCWGKDDCIIGFLSSIKAGSSHRNTTGRNKQAHSHKLIDGRLLVAHAEEI